MTPIAIVGRACTLPGAHSPEELWQAVLEGRDLTSDAPPNRWGLPSDEILCSPDGPSQDRAWSERGGYVRDFTFDPSGYGIPADQLSTLDPVFQLTLHTARAALRDAGLTGDARTGAILGNLSFPTEGLARFAEAVWHQQPLPDARDRFMSALPTLILHDALGLGARLTALDAACASSLYALKLACDELADGRADVMLAGGVSRCDDLFIHVGFCALGAMSKTGQSRPFHAQADGLVPAEGAVVLTLKRLTDAERDGDTIHGVIRGVGLSNDGRGRGFLAPSADGQERAIRAAYAEAGVTPSDIGLLECHATGTTVGDATELESAGRVFHGLRDVPLGSLKSNLGHLITAAGGAGVLKTIEAMRARTRPPTRPVASQNPKLRDSPFRLLQAAEPWTPTAPGAPLRAGVSAFGFGGNNAHVVIEQYIGPGQHGTSAPPVAPAPIAIVGIGARVADSAHTADFARALFSGESVLQPGPDGSLEGRARDITLPLKGMRFPPNDLKQTLAQQLLLLAAGQEAVAELPPLPSATTGVIVGMAADPEVARYGARWRLQETQRRQADAPTSWTHPDWLRAAKDAFIPGLQAPGVLGTMPNIPANRLNSQLDLGGPSLTVSAEEISGLVALDIAIRALRTRTLDAALVGAVDLSCDPVHRAAAAQVLAADRQTPGDAAVVLVLKRLDDAERDGDRVFAILDDTPATAHSLRLALDADSGGLTPRFGHAHAASGLVHLTAAALCLHHRRLADGGAWLTDSPRTAAVSVQPCAGPGWTGTLREHADTLARPLAPVPSLHIFSGADAPAVLAQLRAGSESEGGPARLVIVARDAKELALRSTRAEGLLTDGRPAGRGVHFRAAPIQGDTAFVYAGAGAAYGGMGTELLAAVPELADTVTERFAGLPAALAAAAHSLPASPSDRLWASTALTQLHAELSLRTLGIQPHAAIGYSSGETNALFAHRVWSDIDRMAKDSRDSGLFDRKLAGQLTALTAQWGEDATWAVWTVLAPDAELTEALTGFPRVHRVIHHTDGDSVIGGDATQCDALVQSMGAHRCHRLHYDLVVHTPELAAVEAEWRALHRRPTRDSAVRLYSNATNRAYSPTADACADALTQQALHMIDLPATIEQAWTDGVRVFIEHGPQGACSRWIRRVLGDRDAVIVSLDRKRGGLTHLYDSLAALVAAGVPVDHHALSARLSPPRAPRSTGPELHFPAHLPPVVLPPAPPLSHAATPAPAPTVAAPISELPVDGRPPRLPGLPAYVDNPVPNSNQTWTMAPAPVLPPIDAGASPPSPAVAAPAPQVATVTHAAHAAHALVTHAPVAHATHTQPTPPTRPAATQPAATQPAAPPAQPTDDAAPVVQHWQSWMAQLTALHTDFLNQQAHVHTQYIGLLQRSQDRLTQAALSPSLGHAPTVLQHAAAPTPEPVQAKASSPAPGRAHPPSPSPRPAARPALPAQRPTPAPRGKPPVAAVSTKVPAKAPPRTNAPTARTDGPKPPPPPSQLPGPKLDRAGLETHASGRISEIFGPVFTAQDGYDRQVRMPEPPLLLADRMTGLQAEPGSMGLGTIWTETDVREDSWYLNQRRMPAGIMIESGQADLMLISYLGVDLHNKGERVYRLLGCTLTYHRSLPQVGETLRYDIHVDGHANQGDVRLFFFHYDCHIGDARAISVRGGQAGFFTRAELDDSAGILWTPEGATPKPDAQVDAPSFDCTRTAFNAEQLRSFANGDGFACFGPGFERLQTHTRSPRVQADRMLLLDQINAFDPKGGPWKRGYLRAETAISPDDWFFDGHFKNDPCMPGTLMFEGCLQAMAVYMAAMGFTVRRDGWRFEPVHDAPFDLRCRGQVIPTSKMLITEIFIEEVVAGPIPTVWADLLCTCDGLKGFHARRVGLQLVPDWPLTTLPELLEGNPHPGKSAVVDGFRFDYSSLLACAWGRPSHAFGPMYARFDGHRPVARLPGPPYHFLSRVSHIDGPIGVLKAGGEIELEYDIPDDAWYFDQNGCRTMPFAVLLEAALQPCGWLASYVGSTLTTDKDLFFRNLDGTGNLLVDLLPDAGTLRTKVKIKGVSQSAGMIIESFDVLCYLGDTLVYEMDTVFGFFPGAALANQIGLATTDEQRAVLTQPCESSVDLIARPAKYCGGDARLPEPMLLMIDRVTGYWPDAGAAGLGVLRAEKTVDPNEWFFKAHFYQDPVQPGSLGIEAMIQLLQWYLLETGAADGVSDARFEPLALGKPLTWKYRGQVVPENRLIQTTIEITETGTDDRGRYAIADASLWVDGKRIYEARNMGMRVVSGGVPRGPSGPSKHEPKAISDPNDKESDSAGATSSAPADASNALTVHLDPSVDTWVNDHRPTFTVPTLPLMGLVDLLAQAAPDDLIELEDVQLRGWVKLDTATTLIARRNGDRLTLTGADGAEVARARFHTGSPPPRPRAWAPLEGQVVDAPYANGQLFHGPAFQVLERLVMGSTGSSSMLRATSGVPTGRLNPALLDGVTHGIPHDNLQAWSPKLSADKVAYPARIQHLRIYGPTPTTGTLRCEVRFDGVIGSPDLPAFRIQLIGDDGVWVELRLIEAAFPKGPLGRAEPLARRAFLAERHHVPGVRLSWVEGEKSVLNPAHVSASDWLPGTVQAIYGTTSPAEIVANEHIGALTGVHPGAIVEALPLTRFDVKTSQANGLFTARTSGPEALDLTRVKQWWGDWFGVGRWPVEDLYYGMIQRYLRRVVVPDPAAFASVRGRSVLYLANHQTAIESLVFSIVVSALAEVPTVTLAKAEHRHTWLGRLIAHCFSWPGVRDPQVMTFFDRDDKASLPRIIGDLARDMAGPGRSVMVHVEGTRATTCRARVEKMSGAFIDMAMKVGAPIVPVRFTGGLPISPLTTRTELPVGHGRQDVWLGSPIHPEELASLHYGARKQRVVQAINALGPDNAIETPLAARPDIARATTEWSALTGASAEHAALACILRDTTDLCAASQALLEPDLRSDGSPQGEWSAEMHRRLWGSVR